MAVRGYRLSFSPFISTAMTSKESRKEYKMIVGYTTGVFDLFHIGHLNILRNAKSMCDRLIVGVTTDDLLMRYKNRRVYDEK